MKNKKQYNSFSQRVADALRLSKLLKIAIGGYIMFHLASVNGCLDSNRTKEASRLYSNKSSNLIKVVQNVTEEYDLHYNSATWMDPQVTRKVTFDDSSETILSYRTHAWQPFMRWKNGEEFKPQVGEKYLLTKKNQLVRKLE